MKVTQNKKEMFSLVISAGDLFNNFDVGVDVQTKENMDGYQRNLSNSRSSSFLRYLVKKEGISPLSVLLNYRDKVKFIPVKGSFGNIHIPNKSKLWVVDGQHRLEGLRKGVDISDQIKNFEIPIILMSESEPYPEALQFFIVNKTQKGVKADLAQTFLLKVKEDDLKDDLPTVITRGLDWIPKALEVMYVLNDEPKSPWYQKIQLPNAPKLKTIITQNSFISSLGPVFKDDNFRLSFDTESIARILSRYWNAIKELCSEAFQDPLTHVMQKTTGTFVLHKLFLKIAHLARDKDNRVTQDSIKKILLSIKGDNFSSEYWSSEGVAGRAGTSQKAFNLLANEIATSIDKSNLDKRTKPFEI